MPETRVLINLSNRHIHVSKEDLEALFGPGHQLTKTKDLIQPGQFACEETVTIKGPKGEFKGVRILGPTRSRDPVRDPRLGRLQARRAGLSHSRVRPARRLLPDGDRRPRRLREEGARPHHRQAPRPLRPGRRRALRRKGQGARVPADHQASAARSSRTSSAA